MEIKGRSELPSDADLIKEVANIRKPTDAIRVIEEAAIREAALEERRIEAKEIVAEATESESVREAIEKASELRDAIRERAIEVAALATPGGQGVTAAMLAKEVAATVGKEVAKSAAKEVASQAVDATESESLQRVKGRIVETTAAATGKGIDGAAVRSEDASEASIVKNATVEGNQATETADKPVEGGEEPSNLNADEVADDTTAYVDEIPPEGSIQELLEQIAMADGDLSRLDDNGDLIKDPDGKLRPEIEFEVNGTRYTTDERGRITHAEGYLTDTPYNERDNSAQSDVGRSAGKPGYDGGHIRARMNGGSSGNENIVPMRDTINRGDYKQSENEENQMLKEGKQVHEKIEVTYDGDSLIPSKIEKIYTDGEKTVELTVDNVEGSTDLLEGIEGEISDQDLSSLKDEIADMQADGNKVSATSVRREYDGEGNLKSVTVGVTNETTTPREKNYTTYLPKA